MTESVAKTVRTATNARLVLIVSHAGEVQLSSCNGCADTVPEVVRILTKVAADVADGAGQQPVSDERIVANGTSDPDVDAIVKRLIGPGEGP